MDLMASLPQQQPNGIREHVVKVLSSHHIETLEEFQHADPDDHSDLYRDLSRLYGLSSMMNPAGFGMEGWIFDQVQRVLISDPHE